MFYYYAPSNTAFAARDSLNDFVHESAIISRRLKTEEDDVMLISLIDLINAYVPDEVSAVDWSQYEMDATTAEQQISEWATEVDMPIRLVARENLENGINAFAISNEELEQL